MQVVFVGLIVCTLLLRLKSDNITTYICDPTSSCGCSSSPAVLSRIIGGEAVSSLSWGWAVGLYRSNAYYCAGSLIAADLVVTAAHCMIPELTKLSEMTIIGGTNSLSNSDGNGQVRRVLETFVYPGYTVALKVNDIAIIRLSTPFDMSKSGLAIVCLPNAVTAESIAKLEYPVPGTTLVVVGWGVTVYGVTDSISPLRQVTVKAVASESSDCTTPEHEMVSVTSQLCAGVPGGGKDACQGDSGGPLMAFISNTWQLVGLTSLGYGCALSGHSGIYTRVAYFIPFIDTIKNRTQTQIAAVTARPYSGCNKLQTTMIKNIGLITLTVFLSVFQKNV